MAQRRAGIIRVQIDGEIQEARGAWTYNLGLPVREAMIGADGVHGYKEVPQVAFIEGAITDREDLDLARLAATKEATISLELANGKMIVLRDGWFAGEGTGTTEEAEIAVRFEGKSAREIS
jgi:hypothetical protein